MQVESRSACHSSRNDHLEFDDEVGNICSEKIRIGCFLVRSDGPRHPREDEPGKPEVVRDPPLHLVMPTAVDDQLLKRDEEELMLQSPIFYFPHYSILQTGANARGNSRYHAFQHSPI